MKFELYQSDNKEWRWRLKAENHRIIAVGEGYKNRDDALHAIALIKEGAPDAVVVEL